MHPNGRYGEIGGGAMEVNTSGLDPTTSTTGRLGDVRFDTSGNRWTLLKIDGSNYYWAPDGFPAVNTEYVSHISGGVVVYKKTMTIYTAVAGGQNPTPHEISNLGDVLIKGSLLATSGNKLAINYYFALNSYCNVYITSLNIVTITPAAAEFNSRPVVLCLEYKKTS